MEVAGKQETSNSGINAFCVQRSSAGWRFTRKYLKFARDNFPSSHCFLLASVKTQGIISSFSCIEVDN